jgi:hypothetical protein
MLLAQIKIIVENWENKIYIFKINNIIILMLGRTTASVNNGRDT